MSWRSGLILGCLLISNSLRADDQSLWREFGLLHSETAKQGKLAITTYRMKDLTGALAAWEWLRSDQGRPCSLTAFCTVDGSRTGLRTVVQDDNYVVVFDGVAPSQAQVDGVLKSLPGKRGSSLPPILTFLPRQGLVPNSARYVLGPVSLSTFAPQLASSKPGFEEGAEAQVADYHLPRSNNPGRLVIFYYPTPEMARLHAAAFKNLSGVHVKRSGVLVAIAFGPENSPVADHLLSRVQYEAKITWNETPPPSPIKPLYRLFVNIIYLCVVLTALCLTAGLIYACMRLYRRRYGTLEADEAMTTLHLSRDA
jgi:hypothetical protein